MIRGQGCGPTAGTKGTVPAFIEPTQCKPVSALPVGERWTYEIKFDGYRCVTVKRGGEVTLFSRHNKVLNGRFPNVVNALASLDGDFVLDGELVAWVFPDVATCCTACLPPPRGPVRLSPLHGPSGQVLEAVRKLGLEGIVGKRLGSNYEPGERSGAWIKCRANMEQEFVIGG